MVRESEPLHKNRGAIFGDWSSHKPATNLQKQKQSSKALKSQLCVLKYNLVRESEPRCATEMIFRRLFIYRASIPRRKRRVVASDSANG